MKFATPQNFQLFCLFHGVSAMLFPEGKYAFLVFNSKVLNAEGQISQHRAIFIDAKPKFQLSICNVRGIVNPKRGREVT